MRACPSVVMLLFVFLVSIAFTPAVSAYANVTLFTDATCNSPFGEPAQIPFDSSPDCRPVPGWTSSFHFTCLVNVSSTHFSFALYNATNCTDTIIESIDADGPTGQCVAATVTLQGELVALYAQLSCSTAQHTAATEGGVAEHRGGQRGQKGIRRLWSQVNAQTADNGLAQIVKADRGAD